MDVCQVNWARGDCDEKLLRLGRIDMSNKISPFKN